jgi:predicted DNA-binding protein (UPF0251 family)
MTRPVKWRRVSFMPEVNYFMPAGVAPGRLGEVCLSVEEVEAIRLKDLEDLDQEECARRMSISRPTFHRVLENARKKLADALLNGKAIRIGGGNFEMAMRRFRCAQDGHEWQVPFEVMVGNSALACPKCNGTYIQPLPPFGLGWRPGGRRGRRWRG